MYILCALLFAALQPGLAAAVELDGLQGRWVSTQVNYQNTECGLIKRPGRTRLEVTAGRYVLRMDNRPEEVGVLVVHRATYPKGLDLRPDGKGKPRLGIYAHNGPTLQIALADRRPAWTFFGDNQSQVVITFRRPEKKCGTDTPVRLWDPSALITGCKIGGGTFRRPEKKCGDDTPVGLWDPSALITGCKIGGGR